MFESLSISYSIGLFVVSALIIWYFSNKLSGLVDFIDDAFNLGDAFGGTILLSIVTNLPELTIVTMGTIQGDTAMATGNILGGIAVQTLLLSLFDFASRKEKKPLTTLTSHSNSIAQGLFLCVILALVLMGTQFQRVLMNHRFAPIEVSILVVWLLSLLVLKKSEKSQLLPKPEEKRTVQDARSGRMAILSLIGIGLLILVFGVLLTKASENIAAHFEIDGVVFGATILALVTSLPEISGGLAFVRERRYVPIISDIFGGNAFLPVLFLLANLISHESVLTEAHKSDIYLAALSIAMTLVFIIGMVIKSPRRFWGMGLDSWTALVIYILGIAGLVLV
ncbi:sodium:calcium antiporter [Algoriphagus terrigena]|uniref:sodium:calcium antiporter n=1 Tax=Algoriphagus terrigena TaxID=344884 RepID=UPI0004208880|nr:hypothetical protein [Algoriphagus terrigena]